MFIFSTRAVFLLEMMGLFDMVWVCSCEKGFVCYMFAEAVKLMGLTRLWFCVGVSGYSTEYSSIISLERVERGGDGRVEVGLMAWGRRARAGRQLVLGWWNWG